jgi:ectoine hydroxylase-related dioxygenase (phytanoyl-CoA dioxygenase family)
VSELRDRFGSLWIDCPDSASALADKLASGEISPQLAERITRFIKDGYIVIPSAVSLDQTRRLREQIEAFWADPPQDALIENWSEQGKRLIRPDLALRESDGTKLLDFHAYSATARHAIAAPDVIEFLTAIFETRPKAFQSLTFWRGSQQPMHKDTAYVPIEDAPLHLAATWLALEDIHAGTGELEYYVGSHRDPHFLFSGGSKSVAGAPEEVDKFLASLHEDAQRYGHSKQSFLAKEGDVLIWHADLSHGGAPITQPGATRQSLVTHFTPESDNPPYMQHAPRSAVDEGTCLFISQYHQM